MRDTHVNNTPLAFRQYDNFTLWKFKERVNDKPSKVTCAFRGRAHGVNNEANLYLFKKISKFLDISNKKKIYRFGFILQETPFFYIDNLQELLHFDFSKAYSFDDFLKLCIQYPALYELFSKFPDYKHQVVKL
mgnify:CR=1 FL=1